MNECKSKIMEELENEDLPAHRLKELVNESEITELERVIIGIHPNSNPEIEALCNTETISLIKRKAKKA